MLKQLGIEYENSVTELLCKGSFSMKFQPIIEIGSGKVFGFEALLREPDNTLMADPDKLFNQKGYLPENILSKLDILCIGSAIKRAKNIAARCNLFINIRAKTLEKLSLYHKEFFELLDNLNVNAGRIIFEVSETTDHTYVNNIAEYFSEFKKKGIRTAIDDVGASFKWLHHMLFLEPEFLKIDKSFVENINNHTRKQAMVQGLALICDKMGLHIIAEGIESIKEITTLESYKIGFAQGFLLGYPKTAEECLYNMDNGSYRSWRDL